jgi:hypothetical protein
MSARFNAEEFARKHLETATAGRMASPAGPASSARFVNLAAVRPRQKQRLDHADHRLNRAGATPRVRRGFKFRQFETSEFARADEFAQRRRV